VTGDRRALGGVINLLARHQIHPWAAGDGRSCRYKGTVRIAITDTGVGIRRRRSRGWGVRSSRWEPVRQGAQGTGLGLAISRSIIPLHGGKLEIKAARQAPGDAFYPPASMRNDERGGLGAVLAFAP
jgi:two-component system cell cycle sensor histidine kinase PleC